MTSSATRIILICSGKGGVGKTTLTANLGIALARQGMRTAVLDADFGLRNLDLLLGLRDHRVVEDHVAIAAGRLGAIEREVGAAVAMLTSLRVVGQNPLTMALWGLIVAALLVIGTIPMFLGLAVVLPVLGHAIAGLPGAMVALLGILLAGFDYAGKSVNVLNAAFMVGGTVIVAALQLVLGLSAPGVCILVGLTTLLVAIAIAKTMPANPMMDFLSILFRAFYRVEVKGVENLLNAGPNPIIALNHTSFLDAALALSLLPKDPVFAIDSAMAQNWWVKPFLRFTRAMPLDPTKPMATRTLINAVKGGEPLIIFPEGRLTVTGSLMKVYDGAGLIAEDLPEQLPKVLQALQISRTAI